MSSMVKHLVSISCLKKSFVRSSSTFCWNNSGLKLFRCRFTSLCIIYKNRLQKVFWRGWRKLTRKITKECDASSERIRWSKWKNTMIWLTYRILFSAVYAFMMAYANLLYIILSEYRLVAIMFDLKFHRNFESFYYIYFIKYIFYLIRLNFRSVWCWKHAWNLMGNRS